MASTTEAIKNVITDAVNPTKNAEPLATEAKKLVAHKDSVLSAFGSPDFYIQILFVGIALAVAWLMAVLIQRRVKLRLQKHPPKRIDIEFITKPLALLGPLLALLYLGVAKPFADYYAVDGNVGDAMMQLCAAYFLAKCIVLIVQSRLVAYFIASVIMTVALLQATGFSRFTAAYLNSMAFKVGGFHISLLNMVNGIVILVVVFWIAGLLSRTLESYLRRSSALSYNARELTVKFFRIFVYFIALLITLSVMGVDLTAFAVFGGALGVGIGLGLQKITANFVSGITLLMEKSIKIGDLIEMAGQVGWVRQLNIRYTLMETGDGKEILIPNEELISTRVINWTHSTNRARIEIKVGVAYDSNPQRVKELLINSARAHPLCMKDPEPACWLLEFGDSSLNFQLVFWIADVREGKNGPQSDVMMSILEKFRKEGIEIPFPQREVRTKDSAA